MEKENQKENRGKERAKKEATPQTGYPRERARLLLLSQKMMLWTGLMVLLTVGLTVTVVLQMNTKFQTSRIEASLHDLGKMIAVNPLVVQAFRDGRCSDELNDYIDSLIDGMHDVDIVTLADMNSLRLYHLNKELVGKKFVGGDENDALAGKSYFSRAAGTMGEQLRYFIPVTDGTDGPQIGFLIVGALDSTIKSQQREIYLIHVPLMLMVLVIALLGAWLFARGVKKSLLGYEPRQISRLFLDRVDVLNSLEEGIVGVGIDGYISMANTAARTLLGLHREDIGTKDLDVLYPQICIGKVLLSGQAQYNNALAFDGVNILCTCIPIKEGDAILGAVAILRNRTELTHMAEELTGVNHMMDALRSNTHEFMNKLQVILGLLRIGEPQEAEKYITGISREHSEVVAPLLQKIQNKNLGALILGKISHCRELDINFSLSNNSSVPAVSSFLSGNAFVTLVGNLLENAIEAVNAKPKDEGERSVTLMVREDERSLMITVDDTGEGMTPEEIQRVQQGGYSSKGRHRGTGMRLIRSVLAFSGGELQIDSEKGVGTSMTVCFTRREKRD